MKKRLFAVMMMLVMLLAAMVITAQAATVPENVEWIELGSKEDFLEWFSGTTASKNLTENYTAGMTRYYKLTADITIDVNSTVYYLADTAAQVNTYFDLNGHTLTYSSPASAATRLFNANHANTTHTFVNGTVVNNSTANYSGSLFLMSTGNLVMEDVVINDNARKMTYSTHGKVIYSAAGGICAIAVTMLLRRILSQKQLWVAGCLGAIAHSVGQMAMAVFVTGTPAIAVYLPIMIACGIVAGLFTGLCAQLLVNRGGKIWKITSK